MATHSAVPPRAGEIAFPAPFDKSAYSRLPSTAASPDFKSHIICVRTQSSKSWPSGKVSHSVPLFSFARTNASALSSGLSWVVEKPSPIPKSSFGSGSSGSAESLRRRTGLERAGHLLPGADHLGPRERDPSSVKRASSSERRASFKSTPRAYSLAFVP